MKCDFFKIITNSFLYASMLYLILSSSHCMDALKTCSTGVGCDAKVALEIHNLREENPEKFYNQVRVCLYVFSLLIVH